MGVLSTALLLVVAQTPSCADAEDQYRALDLEKALATAEQALAADPARPLPCLQTAALALLVLGRTEEARARLVELFERAPDHRIEDASLAPAMRELIEQTRASLAPLSARVTARWIVHESLRIDFALDGGLRGARSVRFETALAPQGGTMTGKVDLEGRAATATVAVPVRADAKTMTVNGRVVDDLGREVHQFSSQILLPERPANGAEVVEVSAGTPWWVWGLVGAAVVGSAVTVAVIAQPGTVDTPGQSLGRIEVPK